MYGKKEKKRLKPLDFTEIFNVLQEDWKRVELTSLSVSIARLN